MHSDHLAEYQRQVAEGKVLVIAHENLLEVAHADRILRESNPLEVHVHAPDSADAVEITA